MNNDSIYLPILTGYDHGEVAAICQCIAKQRLLHTMCSGYRPLLMNYCGSADFSIPLLLQEKYRWVTTLPHFIACRPNIVTNYDSGARRNEAGAQKKYYEAANNK